MMTAAERRKLIRMRARWIKDAAFLEKLFPIADWENSFDDHHDLRRNFETAICWANGVLARRTSQHTNGERA